MANSVAYILSQNTYPTAGEAYNVGVLQGTRTSTPSTIYSVGIHKISGTDYGGEVKGNIAIVRHYNKALTAQEVAQNFTAQQNRFI